MTDTSMHEGRSPMIIVRRISHGISAHFAIRVSEWVMMVPNTIMGTVLAMQPDMFDTSPSFAQLAARADEKVWAIVVLLVALLRLIALGVNGTFRSFPYSPHLRMIASIVSMVFWAFFIVGFLLAAMYAGGAWSPLAYTGFLTLEMVNLFRSSMDRERHRY